MAPKKKEKAVKMSLQDFIADETYGNVSGGSWADTDVDPTFSQNMSGGPVWNMGARPEAFSGARAEREGYAREVVPIPDAPPFTARITNLDYNVEDGALERELFDESYGIVSARYPRDMGGKFRGYVFIEFGTREGLEKALKLDGTPFVGRQLRIAVAERRLEDARFGGNWRSGNRGPISGFERGAPSGEPRGEGGFDDRNYDNWERKGPLPGFQSDRPPRRGFMMSNAAGDDRDYDRWERKGPMAGGPSGDFEHRGPPREPRPVDDRDYDRWERKGPMTSGPPAGEFESRGPPRERKPMSPADDRDYDHWERKGPLQPPVAARKPFTERKKSHTDAEDEKSFDNWRAGKTVSGPARAHHNKTHGTQRVVQEKKQDLESQSADSDKTNQQVETISKRFDILRTSDDDEDEENKAQDKNSPQTNKGSQVEQETLTEQLSSDAGAENESNGDWSTPQRRTRGMRTN